jgi:preprotein translocase subunit SecA
MIADALGNAVRKFVDESAESEQWNRSELAAALAMQYLVTVDAVLDHTATPKFTDIDDAVHAEGEAAFQRKVQYLKDFGGKIGVPDVDQQVLSQVMLQVIDEKWKDHLYDLDQLRNAIQYRAYGQKDPLVEYKKEAFEMFQDLMRDLRSSFTERFLKVQVNVDGPPPPPRPVFPQSEPAPADSGSSTDDLFAEPVRAQEPQLAGSRTGAAPVIATSAGRLGPRSEDVPKVGRNDPCPCGSGRKYKKCHGAAR